MDLQVVTEADSGGTVEVRVAQPVTIELGENPTTGYRWEVEADPGVAVESAEYAPHAAAGVGGGGTRRFVVSAQRAGELAVRAVLRREWQKESSTIKRFELTLHAQ